MNQKKVRISSILLILVLLYVLVQPVFAIPGSYYGENQGNNEFDPSFASEKNEPQTYQNVDSTGEKTDYQNKESNNETNTSNPYNLEKNESSQQIRNTQNNEFKKQYRYQKGKQDMDGDFVDDHQERYQHRKMMMTCDKNQTRIRSEWMHENITDAYELLFTNDNGLIIHFHYNPYEKESNKDIDFDVYFNGLIEYLDNNSNGRYDKSDEILTTYSLSNAIYVDLTYSTILSEDNETISVVRTKTIDDQFSIVLYVTGNYSNLQNQVLSPSEVKMDFIIDQYDFTNPSSYLALDVELHSTHSVQIESDTFNEKQGFAQNENELNISSRSNNCFFSWLEYAHIDNEIKKVNVSVYSTSSQTIINESAQFSKITSVYFTYPQGDNIVHDPKIGVMSISYQAYASSLLQSLSEEVSLIVFFGICIAATLLFLGSIYLRKKI